MTDPSRAELWMAFAAAAMGIGDANDNTATAAKAADRMLVEFDKRFPQPGEDPNGHPNRQDLRDEGRGQR